MTPLHDLDTMEEESITLILEISKPRKVTWLRAGKEVTAEGRFKVTVDDTGLRHTLTIEPALLEDSVEISVNIDDLRYGIVNSSCSLTVRGEC